MMAQKANGTTLSFTQNGASVAVGRLRGIGEIRMDSEAIDVTTLDGGGDRAYEQGLRDGGEITIEGFHDKTQTGQASLRALYASGSAAPFTVTFPDESTVAFTAFVKSVSMGAAEVDGVVGFSAVLRVTGGVTVTV